MWVGLSSQSRRFTCYYSGNYLIKTKLIRKQSNNKAQTNLTLSISIGSYPTPCYLGEKIWPALQPTTRGCTGVLSLCSFVFLISIYRDYIYIKKTDTKWYLDCRLIIQHDIIIRFLQAVTYRYLSGCTTNVPNGNWQVGEWSWRPWEKSRGRRLSILDIFCLKGNSTYQSSIYISTTKDRTWICTLNVISDNNLHYGSSPQHLM